jgi:hypothetical protein
LLLGDAELPQDRAKAGQQCLARLQQQVRKVAVAEHGLAGVAHARSVAGAAPRGEGLSPALAGAIRGLSGLA